MIFQIVFIVLPPILEIGYRKITLYKPWEKSVYVLIFWLVYKKLISFTMPTTDPAWSWMRVLFKLCRNWPSLSSMWFPTELDSGSPQHQPVELSLQGYFTQGEFKIYDIFFFLLWLTRSRAMILSWAPPLPPEIMAPAWPIRRPGGAVRPAMKDTTGFLLSPCASSCSYEMKLYTRAQRYLPSCVLSDILQPVLLLHHRSLRWEWCLSFLGRWGRLPNNRWSLFHWKDHHQYRRKESGLIPPIVGTYRILEESVKQLVTNHKPE